MIEEKEGDLVCGGLYLQLVSLQELSNERE